MSLTGRPIPSAADHHHGNTTTTSSPSQPMAVPSVRASGSGGGLGLTDGSGVGPTSPPFSSTSPLRSPLGSSPPGSFAAGFLGGAMGAGLSRSISGTAGAGSTAAAAAGSSATAAAQAGAASNGSGAGVVGQKNARGEGLLRRLSLGAAGAFRPNFRSPVTPSSTLAGESSSTTDPIPITGGSPSSLSSSVGGASSIDYPATPMPTPIKSPAIYSIPFTNPFKDDAIHEHHEDHLYHASSEVPAKDVGGGGYFSGTSSASSPPKQERGKLSWPGAGFWSSTLSAASSALDEGHHAASNLHSSIQDNHHHHNQHAHHHQRVVSTPAGIPAHHDHGAADDSHLKPALSADLMTPEAGAAIAASRGRRRFSENQGNKKRGVSPMGEHILRGGGGMF